MKWSNSSRHSTPHDERSLYSEGDTHKITYYHYIGTIAVTENTKGCERGYHAYYKPEGWLNFGQNILNQDKFYMTLEDAKKGCKTHLKEHGPNPCNPFARI
jgi:hypothetical protein